MRHYLGPVNRGIGWSDDHGCLVLAKPTSRRLPQDGTWLELVRWCLTGTHNSGSLQWSAVSRWIKKNMPEVTTIVSYSDPGAGHTGALYRASNWTWAPTWHRLRPPPSGNGRWSAAAPPQTVKDRWIYCLRKDQRRAEILRVKDAAIMKRMVAPAAEGEVR